MFFGVNMPINKPSSTPFKRPYLKMFIVNEMAIHPINVLIYIVINLPISYLKIINEAMKINIRFFYQHYNFCIQNKFGR